jgi:hypothetical protein
LHLILGNGRSAGIPVQIRYCLASTAFTLPSIALFRALTKHYPHNHALKLEIPLFIWQTVLVGAQPTMAAGLFLVTLFHSPLELNASQ